jgi:transcriptional regulator of acetoin/glycerol metabolism
MYELVWKGSGYRIVSNPRRENSAAALQQAQSTNPRSHREIDLSVWKQFVRTGNSDMTRLNEPIRQSWYRCREMGVDPGHGKCGDIRNEPELGKNFLVLRDIVQDTRDQIYSLVRGKGLLVTVSDQRGYLVGMCGDYDTLLTADRLNFGPGANWSEKSVGTNAIGTALASAQPIRVAGCEHFCESHHAWICSAAPFYDIQGDVVGCIDISGPKTSDHTHALALAIQGARAIESRLFKSGALEFQQQSTRLINSVFNAVLTGLVYLDTSGMIRAANPTASTLLAIEANQLIGMTAGTFFRTENLSMFRKAAPNHCEHPGIVLRHRYNPTLEARAFPVLSRNHVPAGVLLVLEERQRGSVHTGRTAVAGKDPFSRLVGHSQVLKNAVSMARRIAPVSTTVLITGESGTGKDVLARAMHDASRRAGGPFIAVNCGAVPADLIQSTLFGYVEGAFTGARRKGRPGQFEAASGGTLLLDEIAEMPLPMQVNLLRVLEESRITRVGGTKSIAVDVRVMASTNKNLEEEAVWAVSGRTFFTASTSYASSCRHCGSGEKTFCY